MKTKTLGDNTPSAIYMPHKYVYSWLCAYEHLIAGWAYSPDGQYMMILKTGEMVLGDDDEDGCGDYVAGDVGWDIYDHIDSEPAPTTRGCWLRSPLPDEIWDNLPPQYYL